VASGCAALDAAARRPVLYNLRCARRWTRAGWRLACPARWVAAANCAAAPQGILINIGFQKRQARSGPRWPPPLAPEAFLFGLQQLLRQAKAQAPVLVIGLSRR